MQNLWGIGEFVGVICFVWLVVAGFGFWCLTPLVFLLTPFNLLVSSSVSVKAAKEFLKEGRKETKIPFKFQPFKFQFLGFIWLLCREMSSWIIRQQSCFPNKVPKCTSRFRWLCPNSVWSCPVGVFNIGCSLGRHGLTPSMRLRQMCCTTC